MNFDKPPQNEKGNESLEKLENIQEVLILNPELAEVAEKASRLYLFESLKKEKELPQDLKEYYEKHSNNKEWLDILSVYPEELQRKIIEKRPEGTMENVVEIRERLNEEWAKVSKKFIEKLYGSKCTQLENLFDQLPYKQGELISKNDEREINALISDVTHWLDKFAGIYINKSQVFPDENIRKSFGVSDYSPEDLTLTEVRENKEWYEKLDLFVEQYFKFFAAGTKENRLESTIHFLDFAEHFIKKDDERYHFNWLLLKDNLDSKNLSRNKDIREFIPENMANSTGLANRIWYYGNQNNLRYARIIPGRYNIQTKFDDYSEPKLEVSAGAKEIYEKYVETIFPESKIKDVVWHGTRSKEDFENFTIEKNTKEREGAFFSRGTKGSYVGEAYKTLACRLNVNPYYVELKDRAEIRNAGDISEGLKEQGYNGVEFERRDLPNEIQVFESEQIHILGSKKDIENFKNWSEKRV